MPYRTREGLRRFGALPLMTIALTLSVTATAAALPKSGAPVNVSPPLVKGKTTDGKKLKASSGKWSGATPSYSYVWERCDDEGEGCAPIAGAAGARFQTSDMDVGHRLRAVVTATNGEGSASATTAPSAKIAPLAPKKKKGPAISGAAQDGQVLNASSGTWLGTGPLDFAYQWVACSGSSCAPIAGATHASYRATTAELGKKLRVLVTATNLTGSATAKSKPSLAVAEGAPANVGAPSVSGLPVVEQTLTADPGTWGGTGPFTYTYQWRGCPLLGECEDISGATGPTYTVGPLQIANSIEVVVTAHNAHGSSSATSPATDLIKALLPANIELPSITGLLQDGGLLAALTGAWSGSEPLSFSYVWETCNAAGLDCNEVSGAIGGTLGLLASEVGSTVRVIVTATNSAGSTTATSEPTSLVKALLPSNTGLPSITGLLQDGSSLLAGLGSWSGTGPLSFSQVWELCDAAGQNCNAIEGAVGSTLALIAGEVGGTVRLAVTATNGAGSTTATSEPTSLVKALLPSNTGLPSITGLLQDGSSLTAALGSWSGTGPLSFSQVWELCDAAGQNCNAIEGAVGSTLALIAGEVGKTVRLAVTASNGAGSATARSEPTNAIGSLLPSNTGLPSITGLLQDGGLLSAVTGSWGGTEPFTYGYQWLLCNAAGASCKEIPGATKTTLGLLTSMIGSTARLVVTATNGAGSTSATSEPTSLIKALLPSNTALPSIVGSLIDGSALTGAKGTWSGSEPSFSQVWELCDAAGQNCKAIEGAVGPTLGLLTSQIGHTVRLAVTATNSAGSTTATSEPTSVIKALLPSNTALPSIVGSLIDGSALTGAKGSWSGSEPTFAYQWLLCNSAGAACKEVSGATGTTLGLLTGMIGQTARLVVTATNGAGSTSATSEPTSVIKALLPSNTALPSITGLAEDAQTLTGAKGAWTGSEPAFSYQWLLCNSVGAACKEVSGPSGAGTTLGLLTSMIGQTARLVVTATNGAGSTSATSEPTSPILAILPANPAVPTIAGILQVGKILEAVAGGKWTGSAPVNITYQWQTCGLLGKQSECVNIKEAVAKTLKLELLQVGLTMRVIETATNARGSVSKPSAITSTVLGLLLNPVSGSTAGGTAVTLAAPGVSKASAVQFGSKKTTEIEVNSPDEITAIAPAGAEGTVPVTVSTPEGSTHPTPEDQFTYEP
ncbi:MAG: hypothetical protein QOK19_1904 [Solirubrobacteraceae bacterium]|nr:hypothetical protein [Solirubrobacteraceae bacterium]